MLKRITTGAPWEAKVGYCRATSDGKRVVTVFHPGLIVCYDLDGALLWSRALNAEWSMLAAWTK